MIEDAWPLFGLVVRTGALEVGVLELRLPREDELAELAQVAAGGVHRPGERPFLTPWTEGTPEDRARHVVQSHWHALGTWEPGAWSLGLAVLVDGRPLGRISLSARDFRVVREVRTSSWLGLEHQGRGLGTLARAAVLALAFDHLGAEAAMSEVFPDNAASQAVSRALGYEHDGTTRDARGEQALVSDRLRLRRERWTPRPDVTVEGLGACLPLLGLG